jgi:hypothetical protein
LLNSGAPRLKDLTAPEYLAEDLTADQPAFDAVAILGEEPSSIFDRFIARYETLAPGRGRAPDPGLLTERSPKARAHVLSRTSNQLAYMLLDYPRESLYAFRTVDGGAPADGSLVLGLARLSVVGPAAAPGLPLLLSDAAAKLRSGSLSACCWQTLKRALADSALLSMRWIDAWLGDGSSRGADRQARRESLERMLAVDAFLGGRSEGTGPRDRDRVIRGLLLLAHLQLAGCEATVRRVQAMTKLALSTTVGGSCEASG